MDWRDYRNRPNPTASALMSKMGVAEEDKVKVKVACYKMLAGLKLNRKQQELISGFVETYVTLDDTKQKEFEMTIESELGKQKKRKPTDIRELLREVGEERGEINMLLNILTKKFGSVSEEQTAQVWRLSANGRRMLGGAIFEFNTPQDLADWLTANR